jgi:hypothetical protein
MSKAHVALPAIADGLSLHYSAIVFVSLIVPDGAEEGTMKSIQYVFMSYPSDVSHSFPALSPIWHLVASNLCSQKFTKRNSRVLTRQQYVMV